MWQSSVLFVTVVMVTLVARETNKHLLPGKLTYSTTIFPKLLASCLFLKEGPSLGSHLGLGQSLHVDRQIDREPAVKWVLIWLWQWPLNQHLVTKKYLLVRGDVRTSSEMETSCHRQYGGEGVGVLQSCDCLHRPIFEVRFCQTS